MADVTPLRPYSARAPRAGGAPTAASAQPPWLDWWRIWLDQWARAVNLPGSGPVVQDIAPETHWFSPTLEFNIAGNRRIEGDVVANVASYGKQLGIVTEALLALAGDSDQAEVERLRELAGLIEARKRRHKADLADAASRALDDLERADPAAYARLVEQRAKRAP